MSVLDDVFVESKFDVRVVLLFIFGVCNEIIEGWWGIWIYGGVKDVVLIYFFGVKFEKMVKNVVSSFEFEIL